MSRVFISYSHKDIEIVEAVADYLVKSRILVWFDKKSIEHGDMWQINIATAISSCDVFLLFNSNNYLSSEYCRKEFRLAKQKRGDTAFIIVDLDGAKDAFSDDELTQYQQICASGLTIDALCSTLFANQSIKRCLSTGSPQEVIDSGTQFMNAIGKLKHPSHYVVLEPLIRFLAEASDNERKGRYISRNANFSSFMAFKTSDGRLRLSLEGDSDYTDMAEESAGGVFVKNVMRVLFGFANMEFQAAVDESLVFAQPFVSANHRFSRNAGINPSAEENLADKRVYEYLNERIAYAYSHFSTLDELIDMLYGVCQASRFYELLDSEFGFSDRIDYEITAEVLHLCRMLYSFDAPCSELCEECIPKLICENDGSLVDYKQLLQGGNGKVFLHTNYGGGTSSLLAKCFEDNPFSLYINLATPGRRGKNMLIKHLSDNDSLAYRLNFYKLFNFSAVERKITLLIDNFDLLSGEDRQFVLANLSEYGGAFNIVFASSNVNVDNKLALTQNQDVLADYVKYHIAPLDKQHFVAYIRYKLDKKQLDGDVIASQFAALDEQDSIFEIFDSFTKINLLVDIINNVDEFCVSDIKDEFDSRIKVYKNIFEGDSAYSIPKKISLLFRYSVVDIEDVIIELVRREFDSLKEISYAAHGITDAIPVENNSLRFRDYYPMLSRITDKYYFLNDDIRSYLSASYVYDRVGNVDFEGLYKLLLPVKNEYSVLKYLKEFDILSHIDINAILGDEHYEQLALILFKILQYYDSTPLKKQFLQNARFKTLPDKFFFGAENLRTIVVPTCVEEVGRAVFSNAPLLEKIDFAPRAKALCQSKELTIKPWAIINCPRLERIKLPSNYVCYKHPLVSRCYALERLEIEQGNEALYTINNGTMLVSRDKTHLYFATNALSGVVEIPASITTLETNCLSYLKNVTEYVLPASVVESDTNFSDFCDSLVKIRVAKDNPVFSSDQNGYMYTDNNSTLFRVPSGIKEDVIIPYGVRKIGSDSISCCMYTKRIFVPDSVEIVENYAFADTYELRLLEFEDIDGVTELGNYIFLSTNEYARIRAGRDYTLKSFNDTFMRHMSREKRKGVARRAVCFEDFESRGIEILKRGALKEACKNLVVARDITLFNKDVYDKDDFNVMLVGMTEYNAIMSKDPISADEYVKELIERNHISAVLFSRDLPILSQFEGDEYGQISVLRTSKSSTGAARILSDIIRSIGESK